MHAGNYFPKVRTLVGIGYNGWPNKYLAEESALSNWSWDPQTCSQNLLWVDPTLLSIVPNVQHLLGCSISAHNIEMADLIALTQRFASSAKGWALDCDVRVRKVRVPTAIPTTSCAYYQLFWDGSLLKHGSTGSTGE